MIITCPHCLQQSSLCDDCGGEAVTIVVHYDLPSGDVAKRSLVLCTNIDCKNYGIFLFESNLLNRNEICPACAGEAIDQIVTLFDFPVSSVDN